MDHLHVVFSVVAGRGICVLASNRDSHGSSQASDRSHRDRVRMRLADGRARADMAIANHARPELEASQSRFSNQQDLRPLARQYRAALLHTVDYRAIAPGVVCAISSRCIALSIVCAIERRLVARPGDLSVRGRTRTNSQGAGDRVVTFYSLLSQ